MRTLTVIGHCNHSFWSGLGCVQAWFAQQTRGRKPVAWLNYEWKKYIPYIISKVLKHISSKVLQQAVQHTQVVQMCFYKLWASVCKEIAPRYYYAFKTSVSFSVQLVLNKQETVSGRHISHVCQCQARNFLLVLVCVQSEVLSSGKQGIDSNQTQTERRLGKKLSVVKYRLQTAT